jgi:hypothetical protein
MRKRKFYKSLAFGGAALLVVALVALLTAGQTAKWVGHTDLEVRFDVIDANSGQPIPNATVHVHAEPGGLCADSDAQEFTIASDEHGHAMRLCKSCMCCGSRGLLEDTFAVYLPFWWFHATAAGYSDASADYLDVPKFRQQVRRGNPSATIAIPIPLRKHADSSVGHSAAAR